MMTDDFGSQLAEDHLAADHRARIRFDGGPGNRDIDHAHGDRDVVVEAKRGRVVGGKSWMPALVGRARAMAPAESFELGGQLLPLVLGDGEFDGKTAVERPDDIAFEAADLLEVGNDPFAHLDRNRSYDRGTTTGDVL